MSKVLIKVIKLRLDKCTVRQPGTCSIIVAHLLPHFCCKCPFQSIIASQQMMFTFLVNSLNSLIG